MSQLARIACPNCPRDLQFRPEHVGRWVACRFCGFQFRLPSHVPISCPECHHEGLVKSEHLGRKTRCKACQHVFRALFRRPITEPTQPAIVGDTDARIERLHSEIARRDQALAEAYEELNLARRQFAELRDRREALPGKSEEETEDTLLANEWAVIADEPSEAETAHETRSEIIAPDLHREDDDLPATLVQPQADADMPRTQPGPSDDRDAALITSLREECERLRNEVETLRAQTDNAVLAAENLEILETNLANTREDAQRLSAERDEARREFEVATRSSQALQHTLNALERDRDEDRDEIRVLEAQLADALDTINAREVELADAHATINALQAPPASSNPDPGPQPEITADQYYEMARERDQARRELNRLRSVLDRLGAGEV